MADTHISFRIVGKDAQEISQKASELSEKKQLSKVLNKLLRQYFKGIDVLEDKNAPILEKLKYLTAIMNSKKSDRRTMLYYLINSTLPKDDLEYLKSILDEKLPKFGTEESLESTDEEEIDEEEIDEEDIDESTVEVVGKELEEASFNEAEKFIEKTVENTEKTITPEDKKTKEKKKTKFLKLEDTKDNFFS